MARWRPSGVRGRRTPPHALHGRGARPGRGPRFARALGRRRAGGCAARAAPHRRRRSRDLERLIDDLRAIRPALQALVEVGRSEIDGGTLSVLWPALRGCFEAWMLQPGDVLVVDMFGKVDGGTFIGDNLAYYIMKKTGTGLVIDGGIRDLEGIADLDLQIYFRGAHPSAISNLMLAGFNIPVRIGGATVMPGDLVLGDREGVYFIPPHLLKEVLERAEVTRVHDEWTRKKFDEGKYKSSDIYGSPRDPELKKEYE